MDDYADGMRDPLGLHEQNEWAAENYDPSAIPTTNSIRATYATDYWMSEVRGVDAEARAKAFDRWLRAVEAEAWDQGRAEGWIDGRTGVDGEVNPYRDE